MIGIARLALKTLTGCSAVSATAWPSEAFHRRMSTCSDSLYDQKKALRKVMKAKLRQLSAEDMQEESENIRSRSNNTASF